MYGNCIFKEPDAQLRADGYHGNNAAPQLQLSQAGGDSVLAEGAAALRYEAKPHELLTKFQRLVKARCTGHAALHCLTLALTDTIAAAEAAMCVTDASFVSPVWGQAKAQMKAWGTYANAARQRSHGDMAAGYTLLEHLYEAARIVAASRQGDLELAMLYLEMRQILGKGGTVPDIAGLGDSAGHWSAAVQSLRELQQLWIASRSDLRRCAHLKQVCHQMARCHWTKSIEHSVCWHDVGASMR